MLLEIKIFSFQMNLPFPATGYLIVFLKRDLFSYARRVLVAQIDLE